jgi:hypothetical protein
MRPLPNRRSPKPKRGVGLPLPSRSFGHGQEHQRTTALPVAPDGFVSLTALTGALRWLGALRRNEPKTKRPS